MTVRLLWIAGVTLAAVAVRTYAFCSANGSNRRIHGNAFLAGVAEVEGSGSPLTILSMSSSTLLTDTINDTMIEHNRMNNYQDSFESTTDRITPAEIPSLEKHQLTTTTTLSTSDPLTDLQQQVHSIDSMEELLSTMSRRKDKDDVDCLTVIKYYADYCKLCQRASIQMKRLVTEFPTVQFAKIEQKALTAPSADTLRALGVTKFPWIQIYRNGDCVASFSTGPSHMFMKKVRDTVTLCLDRTPMAWKEFQDEFAVPMQDNADVRQRLGEGGNCQPDVVP